MEEKLKNFIDENDTLESMGSCEKLSPDAVAIARFVHHQVIEMARDCYLKSQEKLISSRYFYEMSENLERLLSETKEKSPEAANYLAGLIKKLLLMVSRPARLLECLEFDPEEFYHLLEQAEGQAKITQGIKTDIPQYIITKLGLNRDPIAGNKIIFEQFALLLLKYKRKRSQLAFCFLKKEQAKYWMMICRSHNVLAEIVMLV